jgi:cbb3-type cytochrome oxidase maturation protein
MSALYFMIPIALLLGLSFVGIFIWNVKNGQYEDMQTPAMRILNEDSSRKENENE